MQSDRERPIDPSDRDDLRHVESLRRAGKARDAEQAARERLAAAPDDPATRMLLALALLDQDRIDEVRRELERAADLLIGLAETDTPVDASFDEEFERAFDDAETDPDELIDPNSVAESAIRHVEAGATGEFRPVHGSSFATRTMAELLERQGDTAGAERLRAVLDGDSATPGARDEVVARLEEWLRKIRRDVA